MWSEDSGLSKSAILPTTLWGSTGVPSEEASGANFNTLTEKLNDSVGYTEQIIHLNITDLIQNTYIDIYGFESSNEHWLSSDFIELDDTCNTVYVDFMYGKACYICLYDKYKNLTRAIQYEEYFTNSTYKYSLDEIKITIESDEKYIRGSYEITKVTNNDDLHIRCVNYCNINRFINNLDYENILYKQKITNISNNITYEYGKYVHYKASTNKISIVSHNNGMYGVSNLIPLNKGDTIKVTATVKGNNVVSFISKWQDYDTPLYSIYVSNVKTLETVEYTALDAIEYIRISYYYDPPREGNNYVETNIPPIVFVTEAMNFDQIKTDINVANSNIATLNNTLNLYGIEYNKYLAYCMRNILFIGDSIMAGSTYAEAWGDYNSSNTGQIDDNIPRMMERMLNATCGNASKSGYSPSNWWNEYSELDISQYSTFIIWLGTNYGPTTSVQTDVAPYDNPENFANSETGYYCRIIEKIKTESPSCFIVLVKVFASKSTVITVNQNIDEIAEYYNDLNILVIDNSDLTIEAYPKLHADINNPHFCKNGNAFIANRFITEISKYFSQDPMRCEFGYTQRTNII